MRPLASFGLADADLEELISEKFGNLTNLEICQISFLIEIEKFLNFIQKMAMIIKKILFC
jgi:hypothetical protein